MKVEKFFGYLFNARTLDRGLAASRATKAERTSQHGVWSINFYHHVRIFINNAGN